MAGTHKHRQQVIEYAAAYTHFFGFVPTASAHDDPRLSVKEKLVGFKPAHVAAVAAFTGTQELVDEDE